MFEAPKEVEINISVATIIKIVLTVTVLVLLFYLRDLILIIISSVVLASAIEPLVSWFERHGIARTLGVIIIYLGTFLIALGAIYFLLPPLFADLSSFVGAIPQHLQTLSDFAEGSNIPFSAITLDLAGQISFKDLMQVLEASLTGVTSGALQTASVLFGGILSFVLILVISFYLAVQNDGVENVLRVLTPLKQEKYVIDVWKRSRRKIGLWMQGQVFLGIFIAIFVYLGLALLGIKYAFLLAILAGVFELIPYVGPVLSAAPAVFLGFTQDPLTGLLALGFFIIIQQFENHLLYPLVVKKMVGVPALMVIISMIVGAKLAGFLGILIAVPVAAILMELISDWEKKKHVFAEKSAP